MSRTWLITGGTSEFGLAYAQAAIDAGDQVALTARRPQQLTRWAQGHGDRAAVFALDVTNHAQQIATVADVERRFGRIDVLVNNAGGGSAGAVEDMPEETVRDIFAVNFFGTAAMIRAVLPGMRARRSGHIVNISSVGGIRGFPGVGFYNAAKFAVEGLSDALRHEVKDLGINILVVEPGAFRTHADSAAYSTAPAPTIIEDYAPTVGALREALQNANGRQPGDPDRAAQAVIQALATNPPPHRLVLGSLGFEQVVNKLQAMLDETRAWEATSRSADYPASDYVAGTYL